MPYDIYMKAGFSGPVSKSYFRLPWQPGQFFQKWLYNENSMTYMVFVCVKFKFDVKKCLKFIFRHQITNLSISNRLFANYRYLDFNILLAAYDFRILRPKLHRIGFISKTNDIFSSPLYSMF